MSPAALQLRPQSRCSSRLPLQCSKHSCATNLQLKPKAFHSSKQGLHSQQASARSLVHTDEADPSGRTSLLCTARGDSSATSWARQTFSQQRHFWDSLLQLDRALRIGRGPEPCTAAEPKSLQEELPHKQIVQNKLNQILASGSDSEEDEHRDPLEEVPVENNQAVASFGRAVYEVLRIDPAGRTRSIYVKRRDLLRGIRLQPRDLRRIDPSLGSLTKPTPNITVKENALLVHLGGVRAILMADKCLLFDPDTVSSRKFLEVVIPRLQASGSNKRRRQRRQTEDQMFSEENLDPPFELECLEGAFLVAIGRLDAEMEAATRRMALVLNKLPREITPVNLEELRRVKQALVELESKADQLRDMVEEIMDDEDEVRDLNLSSRPLREERRRSRERERLERGMARSQREAEAGIDGFGNGNTGTGTSSSSSGNNRAVASRQVPWGGNGGRAGSSNNSTNATDESANYGHRRDADGRPYDDAEEGYQEAEAALEEMEEAEEEEREVEEVEDLLEYYLQRAAATQSEAERLLDGARDLEESIGVSLSARRFEVNRLELTLSIGSFAAGLGAMIAGIFGMNLTSTFEQSVIGFWGTTAFIVLGCIWVVWALYSYTRRRRIL